MSEKESDLHPLDEEATNLNALIDAFSSEQLNKLIRKMEEGYHGWDDPENLDLLYFKLKEHIERFPSKKNMIDIASLSAFIWGILHAEEKKNGAEVAEAKGDG